VIQEIEFVGVVGKLAEVLVVIAEDQFESAELAEAAEEVGEFALQFHNRNAVVDDITEDGEVCGFVECAEVGETLKNIIVATQGHELALVTMGPGVAEVEIRNAEDAVGFQEGGAAMVEPDAG
jgi:hypothetical protein